MTVFKSNIYSPNKKNTGVVMYSWTLTNWILQCSVTQKNSVFWDYIYFSCMKNSDSFICLLWSFCTMGIKWSFQAQKSLLSKKSHLSVFKFLCQKGYTIHSRHFRRKVKWQWFPNPPAYVQTLSVKNEQKFFKNKKINVLMNHTELI